MRGDLDKGEGLATTALAGDIVPLTSRTVRGTWLPCKKSKGEKKREADPETAVDALLAACHYAKRPGGWRAGAWKRKDGDDNN
jgi:hypothetical protein